ncbi:hypothetical protein TorRG33x02_241760 [Trema orientale]|uniref:Uncharacterized protein n=1 Tax=Trema orientale TaxID=63057 RepID=A0A2P5DU05_TREOI|nr:hypothetical protein TorRG33x02_241760 [Trema orientale]
MLGLSSSNMLGFINGTKMLGFINDMVQNNTSNTFPENVHNSFSEVMLEGSCGCFGRSPHSYGHHGRRGGPLVLLIRIL